MRTLLFLPGVALVMPQMVLAQQSPSARDIERFAARARREVIVGIRVRVPDQIFRELSSRAPNDFEPCDPRERSSLAVYRVPLAMKGEMGLAVQGRGFCYCSATGNCAFWVYRKTKGEYCLVLEADMVQVFGLLHSREQALPILIVWSHDSGTERSANVFRFNGTKYEAAGAWIESYEYAGTNGNVRVSKKPKITSHFATTDTIPD